jgi:hypothetical protein
MIDLPEYSLLSIMSQMTTRDIPMSSSACVTILEIINNDSDFQSFVAYFAGLVSANSIAYRYVADRLMNVQKFFNISQSIYVPSTLFQYLEYMTWNNNVYLDDGLIQKLVATIQMTPEFTPYLQMLEGITPETSRDYIPVIEQLNYLPLFKINSQLFLLSDEENTA